MIQWAAYECVQLAIFSHQLKKKRKTVELRFILESDHGSPNLNQISRFPPQDTNAHKFDTQGKTLLLGRL